MRIMKKLLYVFLTAFLCMAHISPVFAQDYQPTVDLYSNYALVMSRSDHEILYAKNEKERMYPASMTKMMTAIVALDAGIVASDQVEITAEMISGLYEANASVAGFSVGNVVTVEDLLYGVALPSGADACNAIAYHTYGDVDTFVNQMNQKASDLGMNDTHFTNITGLHDDDHYTTAYDLAILLDYCLQNELFQTIFSAADYTTTNGLTFVSTIRKGQETSGYSLNGLVGGKTGFTIPAGHCLASWSHTDSLDLIMITGGAEGGYYETTHLADTDALLQTFNDWTNRVFYQSGDELGKIVSTHPLSKSETISIYAPKEISIYASRLDTFSTKLTTPTSVEVSNHDQTIEGEYQIFHDDTLIQSIPVSLTIKKEQHFFDRIVLFFQNLFSKRK